MQMSGDIKRGVHIAICFAIVALISFILWNFLMDKPQEVQTVKPQIKQEEVKVDQKTTNTTTYQYLPKAVPTDADVEVVAKTQPLIVSINGEKHEIPTDNVKETHKLEKGKLVVTEERQVELNLVVPEQPKFKKGVYIESDLSRGTNDLAIGVRGSYQTKEFDVDLKADLWTKKNREKRIEATVTKWF